jgi:hypothetical protein
MTQRKVLVNADALARLLEQVASGGFWSNELGIGYVDDGSGAARKLVAVPRGEQA